MARNFLSGGWARVDLLDAVGSTNAFALEAATAWHLVAAHEQTAGRGRLTRTWQATPGQGVTVSMTLPVPRDPSAWGWVPLFVGHAVLAGIRDAVRGASEGEEGEVGPTTEKRRMRVTDTTRGGGASPKDGLGIKWPNDVLARESDGTWRKLGGILCQLTQKPQGALVVAGVGINVGQSREELPAEAATSLRRCGSGVGRDAVLAAVAARVAATARGWGEPGMRARLREAVRAECLTLGQDVEVHTPDGAVTTRRAAAIDDDGRLVTAPSGGDAASGPMVAYSVADVIHARLSPKPEEGRRP